MRRLTKKILAYFLSVLTLFSIELLIVWIVFIGSFIVFLFISNEIFLSKEDVLDQKVFALLEKYRSPGLTSFMKGITFLASREFIFGLALGIFVYFLFVKKHHWYSVKIPVVALGSISLNVLLKNVFDRPRPLLPLVEASGLSFPSGHAMVSFSFYGLLLYLAWVKTSGWKRWVVATFLLIVIHLIGLSRIYLQVHYTSDVLAGFALGVIWLVVSIVVLKKIEKFSARRLHPDENLLNSE